LLSKHTLVGMLATFVHVLNSRYTFTFNCLLPFTCRKWL